MKTLTLIIALLFAGNLLLAQSVKFGIKGSLNEAFIDGGPLPDGTVGYFRPGFLVGGFAEFAFKKWSVEPGLFFTVKGYKVTSDFVQPTPGGILNISIAGKQTYPYIELPVNVLYNIKINPGKIFIGGGPYAGYLLSVTGKRNTTTNGDYNYTETQYAVGGDGNFKRIDFGLTGLIGIAFKNGLLFSASPSYGFTNLVINNINNNPPMTKNRVLGFSVGYIF